MLLLTRACGRIDSKDWFTHVQHWNTNLNPGKKEKWLEFSSIQKSDTASWIEVVDMEVSVTALSVLDPSQLILVRC